MATRAPTTRRSRLTSARTVTLVVGVAVRVTAQPGRGQAGQALGPRSGEPAQELRVPGGKILVRP